MNIQQLRYVVATADHGSMTAAATALYVAQPALSRAVRLLERELALSLFQRLGRGVTLTAQGRVFVAQAREALRNLDALRDLAGSGSEERRDQIVIAASPTLQLTLALPLVELLRAQGSSATVRLLGSRGNPEVHDLVSGGIADLGLCDEVVESGLSTVPLGRAQVSLMSPPGLDLPEVITFDQLAGVPLVLPTVGTLRRDAFDAFFETCGVVPTVAVESDERSVWLASVRRGLASCIWHSAGSLRLEDTGVVIRNFEPALHTELHAVRRAETPSPVNAILIDAVRSFAGFSRSLRP